MLSTVKIFGLSALLTAAILTAASLPGAFAASSSKAFTERLAAADIEPGATQFARTADSSVVPARVDGGLRKADALAADCAGQTWPHIDRACLTAAEGAPARKPVRTITIENRTGSASSTLIRVPRAEIAQR